MTINMADRSSSETRAQARQAAGKRAYLSGRAAEDSVSNEYRRLGYKLIETRWRGAGGEIDFIFDGGDLLIFTEVKKARSFELAIRSLSVVQMHRIHAAASEYLAHAPKGQLSNVRFDLAVMDATGEIRILQNAFSHF